MKRIYTHYKNGLQYQVIEHCKLQVNSVWVDAYIYVQFPKVAGVHTEKYVRPVTEFHAKFTPVEDAPVTTDSCTFLEQLRNYQFHTILGKYKLWN